ncbi:MAG: hypothetical protein MUP67_10345 [Acidimicrobiia bacterium]|nr:hypothetical protein [Acidimicrobiia bacterium]
MLVSFASVEFYEAQHHLVESAKPFVDGYLCYRDVDLPRSFLRRIARHLQDDRAFGYWAWKPWVIFDALGRLDDGDLLFYADSGNVVLADLAPLFELCASSESGIVLFDNQDGSPDGALWKNGMWTRGDCFALMDATGAEFVDGLQVTAGYIVVEKRPSTVSFIRKFLAACENYQIISDAPSTLLPNAPNFVDHRHDQSVLSILAVKNGIELERAPCQHADDIAVPPRRRPYPQLFDHHRRAYYLPRETPAAQTLLRRARRRATMRRLATIPKRVTWTTAP